MELSDNELERERQLAENRRLVRGSVEETLDSLLDQEADWVCQATCYERSPERQDTRGDSGNGDGLALLPLPSSG